MSVRVQVSCLAIRDNRLLMIQKNAPGSSVHERLIPPGGHVELHETLEQACAREVSEETGIVVSQLQLQGVVSFIAHTSTYHSVCFFFLANQVSGELSANEPDKLTPHWVELETISDNERVPDYHQAFLNEILVQGRYLNARVEWMQPDNRIQWTILQEHDRQGDESVGG